MSSVVSCELQIMSRPEWSWSMRSRDGFVGEGLPRLWRMEVNMMGSHDVLCVQDGGALQVRM